MIGNDKLAIDSARSKKSWFVYAKCVLKYITMYVISISAMTFLYKYGAGPEEILVANILKYLLIPLSLRFIYRLLYLYSIKLYTDNNGIYTFSGVFPWNKRVYGVNWRDIESAYYSKGLLSWLTGASNITVTHRFTEGIALYMSGMNKGKDTVEKINKLHKSFISSGL